MNGLYVLCCFTMANLAVSLSAWPVKIGWDKLLVQKSKL